MPGLLLRKQTRRAWRTKKQLRQIRPCKSPGECVSVDQLESSTLGFVAQLKGILTKRRYRYATVFVDHYSDFSYVHYHSKITTEDSIQAKNAFEAYARSVGVPKICHYHCDNGRFADNGFMKTCETARLIQLRLPNHRIGENSCFQPQSKPVVRIHH